MHAERIMTSNPVTVRPDMRVEEVMGKMYPGGHHILPVVDGEGVVRGIVSSASIIAHLLPEYIASGELEDVSFVPDIGVLRKHYLKMKRHRVDVCMDDNPAMVTPDESLLAIAAAITRQERNACVLVVDDSRYLLGLITPGDVLDTLRKLRLDEACDA